MKRTSLRSLLAVVMCAFAAPAAFAYDEPAVNLGLTSFLDGIPPNGPGLYFEDYLQYYTANSLKDNNGNNLPLPETNTNVTANIFQFIYLSPQKLPGHSHWGIDVLLPVLLQAKINDGLNHELLQGQTGAGDLVVGPILQFDPVMGSQGPVFANFFEADFLLPTGKYSANYAINPGSNFWSFNPFWAATVWFTPKWSASVRMHYLWNATNNNPNLAFGPFVTNTQAGQAAFANFASEYAVTEKLRIGVDGYFFYQTTDTKANGVDVSGRRERVWALGPGLLYTFSKNDAIFFNSDFEFDVRNRPEGSRFLLRYAHHFTFKGEKPSTLD